MAHHTVTLGLWSGRWRSSRGLLWDQYRKCLLTAKGSLRLYRRTAIFNEPLDNKSAVLNRPSHGVNWERHEHSCLTTHSPLLYPHTALATPRLNRGVLSAAPFTMLLWNNIPFMKFIYFVLRVCLIVGSMSSNFSIYFIYVLFKEHMRVTTYAIANYTRLRFIISF
jgi:hypothetical protein